MAKRQQLEAEKVKLQTPEFQASFPALFEATSVNPGDKKKFSVQMLFQVKETPASKAAGRKVVDIQPLKNLVRAVIEEKFGKDQAKWPPIGDQVGMLKLPWRSGTEIGKKVAGTNDYQPGYGEGIIFAAASSINKPGVVDAHEDKNNPGHPAPIAAPSDVYGGCFMRAKVNAYYWEYMGKKGVSLGLINAQKLKDGEPFGNRTSAANDFDAIDAPSGGSQAPAMAGAGAASGSDIGV